MPDEYAPRAVYVIAQSNDEVIGHVGWARRTVGVSDDEAEIAGVGGVLISDAVRGECVGS